MKALAAGAVGAAVIALADLIAPIAEIGAPFNSTDAVLDPSLPFRRLIRAGHRADDWFSTVASATSGRRSSPGSAPTDR